MAQDDAGTPIHALELGLTALRPHAWRAITPGLDPPSGHGFRRNFSCLTMLGAASRAVWARAGGLPSIRMHAPTLKSQASSFRSSPQACVARSVVTKTTATAVAPAGADSHKILLIGAGLFGRPVAHLWADAGHQLIVADKDPKVAQHVADELQDNVIAVEKPGRLLT